MNRITIICGALGLALAAPAWSQPRLPFGPQAQELPLLPEECRIILMGTDEQRKSVHQTRFAGFVGPNHYCWGLNFMNRARFNSRDKTERRFNLQSAVGEFGYVLRHTPPGTPRLDEVRMQQQMAEMLLKMN
ncbi:MAG: hypothetical protein LC125_04645 [Burkholderiales bacterium]|nr:hypothetical protein [Burkholderiales bacterium]